MAATLFDIARAASVSTATVSRTFNYPDRVSARTRERVLSAAAQLNYTHGATMPAHADGLVFAVIVAEIFNPVFGQYLGAIDEQAWQGGHRILLAGSAQDAAREQEAIIALRPHADGILLLSPRSSAEQICEAAGDTPVVVSNGASCENWPTVLMAADAGIGQAIEHLAALGHEHVAFAPGSSNSWANQNRESAMEHHTGMRNMRLTVVGNQAPTVQGGLSAAAAVAASGATAVIAYNDFVALGLLSGLKSLGLACPRDISIIGIDNGDFAVVSEPPLTSITTNIFQSASRAFSLLRTMVIEGIKIGRIESGDSQLIVRESTASASLRESSIKSSPRGQAEVSPPSRLSSLS